MSRQIRLAILACCSLALLSANSVAQQPNTGTPPFSSVAAGPFDAVDLANLNVHLSVPVFSRAGKGMPFSFSLGYDSLIWVATSSGGPATWTPVTGWGWHNETNAAVGYISYAQGQTKCWDGGTWWWGLTYGTFYYHDPGGAVHSFPVHWTTCDNDNGPHQGRTIDGTGMYLDGDAGTVTTKSGIVIHAPMVQNGNNPSGNGTISDPNGNTITVTPTSITDTLGTTALTISGVYPNTTSYCYTAPNNGSACVTVYYHTYTVTTQFGGGLGEYSQSGKSLVDHITLPDGSSYQFLYEATGTGQPYTGGGSGPVTGRIAKVTLPTGGIITYTYGGTNSMMADGSPSTMTRALGGGTWTYTRAVQSGKSLPQTTTTVVDPANNETDLTFSGIYETHRMVYTGPKTTLLDNSYICYNGDYNTNDHCLTATVTAPITWTSRNDALNNTSDTVLWSGIQRTYDAYGNVTEEDDYNFGTTGGHTLLRKVIVSMNLTFCNSTYNICDRPASVQVTDGTNQKSYASYTYDEGGTTHGSVTTVSSWVSSTASNLLQHYAYNSNGTLASATDPNTTLTAYSYAGTSCNNAFPTSVTVHGPSALTTNYGYNCTGGVLTQVTDPNNATVITSYTDSYFWRPASVTDQLTNATTFTYSSSPVGQVEAATSFSNGNSGTSTSDVVSTPDSLGRPYLQQTREAPGSGNWDTVQYTYDSSGRLQYLFRPFVSTYGQGTGVPPGLPATTYSYDAMGRYTDVTDSTLVHTDYTYNLNDVTVTVTPAPTGEHAKSRQTEYDALGRLGSVCEMSTTLPGVGSCGQNIAQTGYRTGYQYDSLGNLTNVSQGGQSPRSLPMTA